MNQKNAPINCRWFASPQRRRNHFRWFRLSPLSLGLLLLSSPLCLTATPVKQDKVVRVVETWVRHVTANARADAKVERVEPYQENGVTKAYVIHLANGGYCLAGASSLTLPVYFYCPNGTYDPKNSDLQWILKNIAARHEFLERDAAKGGSIIRTNQAELDRRARSWDELAAGNTASSLATQPHGGAIPLGQPISSGPSSMVLPITSQWNQSPPYDDYCPALPAGSQNHAVVGCVATATAQMMYYWKWPNSGVGRGTNTYKYYAATNSGNAIQSDTLPVDPSSYDGSLSSGKVFGNAFGDFGGNGVLQVLYSHNYPYPPYLQMSGWWDDTTLQVAQQITNSTWSTAAATNYENSLTAMYAKLTTKHETNTADYTTPIVWSAMQNEYANEDLAPIDSAEIQVAYLSYEIGVAVKMGYGVQGSGAWDYDIAGALTNHFGYDPDAGTFSQPPDASKMVADIQWLRPCILSGYESSGEGHCWLAYGYNMGVNPWQFNMNMGWRGPVIGLYSLDNVPSGLTNSQDCVTGFAPLKVVGFVGASSSGRGSPNTPYQNIQQALTNIPSGGTLIFQANTINTFSGSSLTINQPVTLKGYNAVIEP